MPSYAASMPLPGVPGMGGIRRSRDDREYRICRVYSETVYNRCIIKYMPVLRSDVRAGSGGRNRENQNRKFMHSRTHPAPRAPPLPRPPSPGPVCGQPRAPSGGAIERCEVRSAPGVEACGEAYQRCGPPRARRPPRGRPRANASTGRNRTTGARRARRGGVCGSTVGVVGFLRPHPRGLTHAHAPTSKRVKGKKDVYPQVLMLFNLRFCVCSFVHAQCPEPLYRRLTGVGSGTLF